MTIEIHNPEVEALILQRVNGGGFRDAEEVIVHALRSSTAEAERAASQKPVQLKTLFELCDPIRGLADDVDFSRNPSTARPLDM